MPEMTPERIAEIRARIAAASEGEWRYFPDDSSVCAMDGVIPCGIADLSNNSADEPDPDGAFIAHARQDVPDLLADNERLCAEMERWKVAYSDAYTENTELRKDKARLDWLEKIGFSTVRIGGNGPADAPGVHSWREFLPGTNNFLWRWTAHWIGSEYRTAREAIDAAMKGKP